MLKELGVYKAIAAVQAELAKDGIGKGRKNKEQGYAYRGIDDVYNHLAPLLSSSGLCILPRILTRAQEVRQTKQGGALFSVVVEAEFDLVSADDGSSHAVRAFGEAMDTADKATNKAMSAAFKNMAFMTFCIPTEGDNDADATTHEAAPLQEGAPGSATRSAPGDDTVSEFKSLVAQAKNLTGLTDFAKKFVAEHHERIAKYGNDIRVSDKQLNLIRDIVAGTKRAPTAAVSREAAQAIINDAPPAWHDEPISDGYGY